MFLSGWQKRNRFVRWMETMLKIQSFPAMTLLDCTHELSNLTSNYETTQCEKFQGLLGKKLGKTQLMANLFPFFQFSWVLCKISATSCRIMNSNLFSFSSGVLTVCLGTCFAFVFAETHCLNARKQKEQRVRSSRFA